MVGVRQFNPDSPPPPPFAVFPPDLPLPPARSVWPPSPSPSPPPSESWIVVGFLPVFLVLFVLVCVGIASSAGSAAAATAPVQPPPGRRARVRQMDELLQQLHRACAAGASNPQPTARRLPAFTYSRRSVKRSVAGGDGGAGEEMCPVCLAAFRLGETVRLLPVCLHLYHAECIDLWLDAHSTCPLCRSDADPSTDLLARLPPV